MDEECGKYAGLFVTDLDGTLLTDQRTIRTEDLESLRILRENRVAVVIATGRSMFSFMGLLQRQDCCGDDPLLNYLVFSSGGGAIHYPSGELLFSHVLDGEDVATVCSCLDQFGLDYMVLEPIPETHRCYYSEPSATNPDFLRRLELYKSYGRPLSKMERGRQGATEILVISTPVEGSRIHRQLTDTLTGYRVIRATSPLDHRSVWIEIFPRQVSKSSACRYLASRLGIRAAKTGGVGNDYNDLDLLEWTGCSYFVANGAMELQGRFIPVASNNDCGVSEAVDHFCQTVLGRSFR